MPGSLEHYNHSKHNLDFLKSFQLPVFASKHEIGKPAGLKLDTKSQHVLRNVLLEGSDEFFDVSSFYISLYKKSRQARYYKYAWTDMEIKLIFNYIFNPLLNWL